MMKLLISILHFAKYQVCGNEESRVGPIATYHKNTPVNYGFVFSQS
jgi:hypothetical protein